MSATGKQPSAWVFRRVPLFLRVLCVLGLGASGCQFSEFRLGEPQPRLVIEAGRRDLGEVRAGEIAEARFPFRNAGDRPLSLAVDGGCSCLGLQYPEMVAPGERAEIVARFGPPATDGGPQQKAIQVTTNEPQAPARTLTLSARVVPFLDLQPGVVEALYRRGEVLHREARLVPRPGSDLRVLKVVSPSPLVKARLVPPAAGDPERAYRLLLEIGPCRGPGDRRVAVRIFTSAPQMPETMLAVAMLAQEGVVVTPPQVVVANLTAGMGGQAAGSVRVFTRSGSLRILGVEVEPPRLRAEVREQDPGRAYQVDLTYAGGWQPGPAAAKIRIRTDDPVTPVLTVPFRTVVSGGA
jgi:hypothetical protein